MYYLLEKRLKQGLNFPDVDFAFDDNDVNVEMLSNKKSNNSYSNNVNINNGLSTITKHNSQLLPKRNAAKDNTINRTASQKNVDFKFIYNNMNNYVKNNENEISNANTTNNNGRPESAMSSKSPSPDFSMAINPIRTTTTSSNGTNQNAAAQKSSRQNYHDIVYRKSNINNNSLNTQTPVSTNAINTSNTDNNKISINAHNYQNNERGVTTASSNISRTDRYFVAMSMNNPGQTNEETNKNRNIISNNNQTNGIRSLPGSIYRGSPERSLPRSPDYTNNTHVQNRPTTSRAGSSKPSVASENSTSEKYYDTHKFKPNYYMSKRSLTSCDESGFERNRSTNVLKSRQLQMGKAKIDLGTQQSKSLTIAFFIEYLLILS
jgi:hypothetical protein